MTRPAAHPLRDREVQIAQRPLAVLLESIQGMGDAERDALLSALGVQPKGKRKRTG